MKPFIVFSGAKGECKSLNDEFKHKCVVQSSSNGWMNEQLTIQWFKSVVGMFSFSRRLLAWDSFEAHMTAEVRATLKSANTEDVIVPGGCTKYVQAPM